MVVGVCPQSGLHFGLFVWQIHNIENCEVTRSQEDSGEKRAGSGKFPKILCTRFRLSGKRGQLYFLFSVFTSRICRLSLTGRSR